MTDTNNLQSEINTLLIPVGDIPSPNTSEHTQVLPLKQIQVRHPDPDVETQSATTDTTESQHSQFVPPIQREPYSYQTITRENANNQFSVMLIIGIVGLTTTTALILLFRQKIFGPLTYSDCIAIPESKIVTLKPKYCVTPDGALFFEKKSDEPKQAINKNTQQELVIPTLQE